MKIIRSVEVDIDPGAFRDELFKCMAACSEAKHAYVPSLRDGYRIKVDLIAPGRYKTYEEALAIVSRQSRRQLTIGELLALNKVDGDIRERYPIFAGDFVLEYLYDSQGETVIENKEWRVGLSAFHRGQILDGDSIFATTVVPRIGSWSEDDFANIVAKAQNEPLRLLA